MRHNHRSDLDHNRGMSSGNHGGTQGYGRGNSQVDQTDYQRGMNVLHEQYNQILTMLGQTNVHGGTEGPSTSHSSQSSANLAQEYPTTAFAGRASHGIETSIMASRLCCLCSTRSIKSLYSIDRCIGYDNLSGSY
ncbi:hypothetical protein H5410_010434 [Solanum commersonii]|uniref:Uncharacterized protein n=1 Tax=Solanum commersonii TaxID=4109 RepID=A0A9J6AKN8_SOLCO|nr:hypothetical protein H5410_010434 [Solanum commersonii]